MSPVRSCLLTHDQLGFTNANMFTRGHVRFLSLDGISFARPVPIGGILRLRSCILHTASTPEHPVIVVGQFSYNNNLFIFINFLRSMSVSRPM
jgi:hypothetical protein